MTRNLSRARQLLSRVNLTGFTMLTLGKNRKYISIKKNSLTTSLKTGFAQISSCFPKTLSCPNIGGLQPPPPGPYACE